jgi:hypothetical protein
MIGYAFREQKGSLTQRILSFFGGIHFKFVVIFASRLAEEGSMVKKFDNTGEDLEDLISIGTIGLIKAMEWLFFEQVGKEFKIRAVMKFE